MRTFEVSGVAEVRITAPVRSICPFDLEIDESLLTITYRPNGRGVELGSLDAYLDGFCDQEISHEELVGRVRADLVEALAPAWITVEDTFTYRGTITLTVRAGERP